MEEGSGVRAGLAVEMEEGRVLIPVRLLILPLFPTRAGIQETSTGCGTHSLLRPYPHTTGGGHRARMPALVRRTCRAPPGGEAGWL